MAMTKAECDMQEKMDEEVYAQNKSLYETLLRRMRERAFERDSIGSIEDMKVLIQNYNNMADSCMRQGQRRRLLENGHG